ncbi:Catalase-peroxidase [Bienertia sinuspersici]
MSNSASTSRKRREKLKMLWVIEQAQVRNMVFEVDGESAKVKCKYCGTRSNVEPCLQVPDEVKLNFRQLLEANGQKSNVKRKKIMILERKKKTMNDTRENIEVQMLSDDDEVAVTFDSYEINLDHIVDEADEMGATTTGGTSTRSDDVEDRSFGYDD